MAEKDQELFKEIKEAVENLNASRSGSNEDFQTAKEETIEKLEEIVEKMKEEGEGEGGGGGGEKPSQPS